MQVVSQHSWLLAPMAVNAVKKIIDPAKDTNVDLKMIKIIKKLGDTVEVGKNLQFLKTRLRRPGKCKTNGDEISLNLKTTRTFLRYSPTLFLMACCAMLSCDSKGLESICTEICEKSLDNFGRNHPLLCGINCLQPNFKLLVLLKRKISNRFIPGIGVD